MYPIPFIVCVVCNTANLLPPPNVNKVPTYKREQIKANWSIKLACRHCGMAYIYYAGDIQWKPITSSDSEEYRQSELVRVTTKCEIHCPFPIVFYTRTTFSDGINDLESAATWELKQKIEDSFFQGLICGNGHPLSTKIADAFQNSGTVIDYGSDWWLFS